MEEKTYTEFLGVLAHLSTLNAKFMRGEKTRINKKNDEIIEKYLAELGQIGALIDSFNLKRN